MNIQNPSFPFDPKIPPALLDLQKWVAELTKKPLNQLGPFNLPVYDEKVVYEIEKRISPTTRLSAAQAIGIYHQQHWFRFLTLAQENFPTLVGLFGHADFNHFIAKPAILKYPPTSWAIFSAIEKLPQWIEEEYKEEDKTFVLQIAQIDATYHKLFYAPCLSPYDPNEPATLQPFVECLELDGDLIRFRNELLLHPSEYWLEHEFPRIDFSKKYFFSLHQTKEGLIYTEISEEEFLHFLAFRKNSSISPPIEWLEKWILQGWIGKSMLMI